MDVKDIIRELKIVENDSKNRLVPTGNLSIYSMARECRRCIEDLEKENEELEAQIENYKISENESKEIIAELNGKIKDLREFADKLSEAHTDEWEKQQEVITELKEIHESDKRSVGIIVKTAKDEIDKLKLCASSWIMSLEDVHARDVEKRREEVIKELEERVKKCK